jgi:hypothetical protein
MKDFRSTLFFMQVRKILPESRHRERVAIFVARETAPNLDRLARQMGRDETKRAASGFDIDQLSKRYHQAHFAPDEQEKDADIERERDRGR